MEDNQFDEAVELKEEKKFDRWISPIVMKLGSVKHERVKACSISSVPEKLRSSKVEAYKPKVVSIGPLHRGANKDLLYMEEIKWRCSHSLFYRTRGARESLTRCSKAILNLVEVLRATYLDEIKIESYELAKIMLVDGCFLLELLTGSDTGMNGMRTKFPGPGSEVGKMEEVLSDLKLLENQIPLFILDTFFKELFYEHANPKDCLKSVRKIINDQVLFLFGYASRDESNNSAPENQDTHVPETAHFLEHIHWYITQNEKEKQDRTDEKREQVVVSFAGQEQLGNCNSKRSSEPKPKLRYCATRLNVARVEIVPPDGEDQRQIFEQRLYEKKHFDNPLVLVSVALGCYKYLSQDGKRLQIHPLHVTAKTQVELRNFIAWEQSRMTHQRFSKEKTGWAFSEYVSLFKDLVCCEEDVKLLKRQKVLYAENLSDEELMNFLRAIVDDIQIDAGVDSSFRKMINRLNNSGSGISRRILWHRFKSGLADTKYMCRIYYQILKRDHTPTLWKTIAVLAAVVLLLLTIAQTIFGALGL